MFKFRKSHRVYRSGSINVTDPEVHTRLKFLGLTEEDLGVIAAWGDPCRAVMDLLVDAFYKHILNTPQTRNILEKHSTIERQRPMLTRYVMTMFTGRIDDEYVRYRTHVGATHDDIDLDSNWYVGMYEIIRHKLIEAVENAGANRQEVDRFKEALLRLIQADIALVVTALTDSRRAKIEKLNKQIQADFANAKAFLDEESQVLAKVAARDLSVQMNGQYNGEYEHIKDLLNTAISNLNDALTQVSSGAEQVASAANQISSGSQSLAQGASQQASSLEQASASFQQISSMSQQNASNAKEARSMTEVARLSTNKGADLMGQLAEAMGKIKNSADATAKIVKTIDEIAFQTNLLALNAAVEAARAGDAGKGFAVVAEEVRNLAMRSAEAAKQTANLIDESVKNADGGVELNQNVLRSLDEINQQVNKVSEVMAEIATASDQQNQGIAQINTAISQMGQITQLTAANAEQSAAAAEELNGQSEQMLGMVGSFQLADTAHQPKRAPRLPRQMNNLRRSF